MGTGPGRSRLSGGYGQCHHLQPPVCRVYASEWLRCETGLVVRRDILSKVLGGLGFASNVEVVALAILQLAVVARIWTPGGQRRVGGVEVKAALVEDVLEEIQLLEVPLEDAEGGVVVAAAYALDQHQQVGRLVELNVGPDFSLGKLLDLLAVELLACAPVHAKARLGPLLLGRPPTLLLRR